LNTITGAPRRAGELANLRGIYSGLHIAKRQHIEIIRIKERGARRTGGGNTSRKKGEVLV